jgi:hypothetical protein
MIQRLPEVRESGFFQAHGRGNGDIQILWLREQLGMGRRAFFTPQLSKHKTKLQAEAATH